MDMEGVMDLEKGIMGRKREEGRPEFHVQLQAEVDALETVGSDGRPLKRVLHIGMVVDTSLGELRLEVAMGFCEASGKWEMPARRLWFRGKARAVMPTYEKAILSTACETGSYEKARRGRLAPPV